MLSPTKLSFQLPFPQLTSADALEYELWEWMALSEEEIAQLEASEEAVVRLVPRQGERVVRLRLADEEADLRELDWHHPYSDRDAAVVQVRATVCVLRGYGGHLGLEVSAHAGDDQARELAAPRVIRDQLLPPGGCLDADRRLGSKFYTPPPEAVSELLVHPQRRLPVFAICAAPGRLDVDPKRLAAQLAGMGHLIWLAREITPADAPQGGELRYYPPQRNEPHSALRLASLTPPDARAARQALAWATRQAQPALPEWVDQLRRNLLFANQATAAAA